MATTTLAVSTSVNPSTSSQSNLEKIESFVNDPVYKEIIDSAMNFNTRLCIERRLRLPFIDTQTGVAQNHCSLFMNKRQRMPGLNPGQIYSYPRPRWRKRRRQYLTMSARAYGRHAELLDGDGDIHSISQIENPALQDNDSKDSQLLSGDAKDWYYDEQDMLEMENYDEPDPDSDLDYEESYSKRKRGRKSSGRGRTDSPNTPGRKRGSGRGRGKKTGPGGHNYEPTPGDPDKPFACELCGARYKTRPGLTYHYGHSHKEGASDENSRDSAAASPMNPGPPSNNPPPAGPYPPPGGPSTNVPPPVSQGPVPHPGVTIDGPPPQGPPPVLGPNQGQVYQDSYVSFLNQSPGAPRRGPPRPPGALPQGPPGPQPMPPQMPLPPMIGPNQAPPNLPPNLPGQPPMQPMMEDPPMPILKPEKVIEIPLVNALPPQESMMPPGPSQESNRKVPPSPYCDFCLGNSNQNKKTGGVEDLVSCHDCGRSGKGGTVFSSDNAAKEEEKPKRGRKKKI
ncbi:hypothetical protein ABEB36_001276 [Hypothenemus hampei]|uniref:C2H2-type domain-containing protein n=1 Tax=Hypothenemus hampei TaxID=57062 RepID=A0ABD1FEY2_HYPHA